MSLLLLFSAPEKRREWGLGVSPSNGVRGQLQRKWGRAKCFALSASSLFKKRITIINPNYPNNLFLRDGGSSGTDPNFLSAYRKILTA